MNKQLSAQEKANKFRSELVRSKGLSEVRFDLISSKHLEAKGPAGESYEFQLSAGSDVFLEINFYPSFEDKKDYVVVYVVNDGAGKDFSLDSWMKLRNIKNDIVNPFDLSSYPGDFELQVEGFFKFLDELIDASELKKILLGMVWENVPFDWGTAK